MSHDHAALYWSLRTLSYSLKSNYPGEALLIKQCDEIISQLQASSDKFLSHAEDDLLVAAMKLYEDETSNFGSVSLIYTHDTLMYLPLQMTVKSDINSADNMSLYSIGTLYNQDKAVGISLLHSQLLQNAT
jgi:hypothetical protein